MSLHVWTCRCGRRWYQFRRQLWDSLGALTPACPGCNPDLHPFLTDWAEL